MKHRDKDSKVHKEEASKEIKEDIPEEIILSRKDFEELQKKAKEKEEVWDKYLRLHADYDNSRKLWERQKLELLKFGNSRILKEFVSIVDEIEAALSNLKDKHPEFEQGLAMIYKKIKEVLQKEGLKPIESDGKIFDPYLHEALFFEERQDLPEHSIIEVIQKGYYYEDKVLRPSGVKVSVHKSAEDSPPEAGPPSAEGQPASGGSTFGGKTEEKEGHDIENKENKIVNNNHSAENRAQKTE